MSALKSFNLGPTTRKPIIHKISVGGFLSKMSQLWPVRTHGEDVKTQQQGEAKVTEDQSQVVELFVASCFAMKNSTESFFVDNGCTNHMTYNLDLFKELNKMIVSKFRI